MAVTPSYGPDGSNAAHGQPSIPRLGDHLLTLTHSMRRQFLEKGSTLDLEHDSTTSLTSQNLLQYMKSTRCNAQTVSRTPSVSSDEDIILIGKNKPTSSERSSSVSRLCTACDSDTLPTSSNEDDHSAIHSERETAGHSSYLPSDGAHLAVHTADDGGVRLSITKDGGTLSSIANIQCRQNPLAGLLDICAKYNNQAHSAGKAIAPQKAELDQASSFHVRVEEHAASNLDSIINYDFRKANSFFESHLKDVLTQEEAERVSEKLYYPGNVIVFMAYVTRLVEKYPQLDRPSAVAIGLRDVGITPIKRDSEAKHFTHMLSMHCARDDSREERRLHIFVDISNIYIGYCNQWKLWKHIPISSHMSAPPFNFSVLAAIMQRNRPTEKKLLVGSVGHPVAGRSQWPQHLSAAEAQGYTVKILRRVRRYLPEKPSSSRKQRGCNVTSPLARVAGMVDSTSSDESISDQAKVAYEFRNGEQGVDELLHLGMMDSIYDEQQTPGTMVLATGDAAQAEFSEGFQSYATRALDRGWNIELVAWKKTLSSAWMESSFRKKYGDQFRVVYLDNFLQHLCMEPCPSMA